MHEGIVRALIDHQHVAIEALAALGLVQTGGACGATIQVL